MSMFLPHTSCVGGPVHQPLQQSEGNAPVQRTNVDWAKGSKCSHHVLHIGKKDFDLPQLRARMWFNRSMSFRNPRPPQSLVWEQGCINVR